MGRMPHGMRSEMLSRASLGCKGKGRAAGRRLPGVCNGSSRDLRTRDNASTEPPVPSFMLPQDG